MNRLTKILLGVVVAFGAMQLVTCAHTNPKATGEIRVAANVKTVLKRACYDCHSNETVWPWYSNVAPISWLVARDVNDGREEVNFSTWETMSPEKQAKRQRKIGEEVAGGDMPLFFYLPMHPKAKLSDADKAVIKAWSDLAPRSAKDHDEND